MGTRNFFENFGCFLLAKSNSLNNTSHVTFKSQKKKEECESVTAVPGRKLYSVLRKGLNAKVNLTGICANRFYWKPIYIGETRCDTQGK